MDTLDAKTRIMNEIDAIDVQVQSMQEKVSQLNSRKNQFKDAYTTIVTAEQQADGLLRGLLKAAEPSDPNVLSSSGSGWIRMTEETVPTPSTKPPVTPAQDSIDPLQPLDQELAKLDSVPGPADLSEEIADEEPDPEEINGRRKTRQVPSFLRQYL